MEFRVLGPLQVCCGDELLGIGGARRERVLAALLVCANEVCSIDYLVDAAWGPEAPDDAWGSLRSHVTRLRQVLEPDRARSARAQVLVWGDGGYTLRVAPGSCDADRFEAAVDQARDALAAGDAEGSLELVTLALAMWRGPAYGALSEEPFVIATARRLEQLRLTALELRCEALLEGGRGVEAAADLEELVHDHPLREHLWELLMLALVRSDRRAEALRAFQRASDALADVGLEPGPALRATERELHLEDRALLGDDRSFEAKVPFPVSVEADTDRLIDRKVELDTLMQCFGAAVRGERRVVLVSGDPGIGKTALVTNMLRLAHGQGATVLYGRADPDAGLPFKALVEAVSPLVLPPAPREPRHGRASHEVSHMGSRMGSRMASRMVSPPVGGLDWPTERDSLMASDLAGDDDFDSDYETERYQAYAGLVSLVSRASAARPVVLVVEDLHWADREVLSRLRYLATSPEPQRLLIVGTYRDTEPTRETMLEAIAEISPAHQVTRIALGGLGEDDLVELAQSVLESRGGDASTSRHRPTPALGSSLHRQTAGNPFFALALLRRLKDAPPGTSLDELEVPVTVREVIMAQVLQLGQVARDVLELAAVAGMSFESEVLERACGEVLEFGPVLRVLESAVERGLLRERAPGQFEFCHALIRRSLYRDIPSTALRRLHLAVARALETVYGDAPGEHVGELAHHWTQGSLTPIERTHALGYLVTAGAQALEQFAPQNAVWWFALALEVQPDALDTNDAERCRLLIDLGEAQSQSGDEAGRQTVLEAAALAEQIDDRDLLVAAALTAARGHWNEPGAFDPDRVSLFDRAVAAAGPGDSAARSRLLIALAMAKVWVGDPGEVVAMSDEALAIARRLGDPQLVLEILNNRSKVGMSGTTAQQLAETEESMRLSVSTPRSSARAEALLYRAWACMQGCRFSEADECLDDLASLARRLRQPRHLYFSHFNEAWRALLRGRVDEAETLATDAASIGVGMTQSQNIIYATQLLDIRRHQGRLGEMTGLVQDAIRALPQLPFVHPILGWLCAETGDLDGARAAYAPEEDLERTARCAAPLRLLALSHVATVCAFLGDGDRAESLYDGLLEYDGQTIFTFAVAFGPVALHLGQLASVLGRRDAAEHHFADALGIAEQAEAPYWRARAELEWARALATHGPPTERPRADSLLADVATLAHDFGYAGLARAAEALGEMPLDGPGHSGSNSARPSQEPGPSGV